MKIQDMTIVQLRKALNQRLLSTKGTKNDLEMRLKQDLLECSEDSEHFEFDTDFNSEVGAAVAQLSKQIEGLTEQQNKRSEELKSELIDTFNKKCQEFTSTVLGLDREVSNLKPNETQVSNKVDATANSVLDEYKTEKQKKIKGRSPLQDEPEEPDDYIDEEMKKIDQAANDHIPAILEDYALDIKNCSTSNENERRTKRNLTDRLTLLFQASDAIVRDADGPIDLDDKNIEEGKRNLISQEIGRLREIMKKQEEEKEVQRKRREQKEKERRENESPISNGRSRSRARSQGSRGSRSTSRSETPYRRSYHKASRHRIYSRSRDRDRKREKECEQERERDCDKERGRDRERDRDRGPRDRDEKKSERDLLREEAKERRKQERKTRKKEAAYQERLRTWKSRERDKEKEFDKEREKKRLKEEETEREAKRLKEFVEDYDDERDNIKCYKGRELQSRLEEREKGMKLDARGRQKEKEEVEELRVKMFSATDGGDPNIEFEKALQERRNVHQPVE